jgi:hypothetical protein
LISLCRFPIACGASSLRILLVACGTNEVLDLESRIRPPEFDALPPEVRELGPMYRAANPDGTRLWAEIEKESRPSMPRTSTLQLAYSVPMRNQLTLVLFEQIRVPTLILTGGVT